LRGLFRATGQRIITGVTTAGLDVMLLGRSLYWLRSAWTKRREILAQCWVCGVESMPVTLIVTMFTGMILALQTGLALARFGQQDLIGALVAVSLAREMAPFMTGLIVAANVGSAIAAEIGTMAVSEEIEALEVMSIDPARFLVMPRLVALMIMMPLLTAIANLIGNIGAAVVGFFQVGVSFQAYYQNAVHGNAIDLKDIYTGLFKAFVFGIIIATIGCGKGLRASGGAIGVGQATRTCVIACFLMIIVSGYLLTSIFYGQQLAGGD
jgi:phospholipid/cholesterol/gamma-HCH transport system permease protein